MRTRVRMSAIAIVIVGAWGALVPFAGPSFGYKMGSTAAWTWTESHATLHLLPGVFAVFGGLLMLGKARARLGATLALLGGAWFVIAPTLHPLWTSSKPMMMMGGTELSSALSGLGYHYGTGVVIAVLAAYALGVLASLRRIDTPVGASGEEPRVAAFEPSPVSDRQSGEVREPSHAGNRG